MSKCSECRKSDSLNTWKDNVADWFAHHIVPKTVKNERSAAFTQGYEDGYLKGRQHERESNAAKAPLAPPAMDKDLIERRAINLFCEKGYPNPLHVFQISASGLPYLNQEPITKQKAQQLSQEAGLLKTMYIYEVIQESIRQEAMTKAVTYSKNWEETLAGKMMLFNLGIIKNIIESISKINTESIPEGSGVASQKMV